MDLSAYMADDVAGLIETFPTSMTFTPPGGSATDAFDGLFEELEPLDQELRQGRVTERRARAVVPVAEVARPARYGVLTVAGESWTVDSVVPLGAAHELRLAIVNSSENAHRLAR